MKADELREMYLSFFRERGHTVIPGSSLIPENDPSVLFTTAGMHPLAPYLLGEPHPAGRRLCDCQKCIRTGDIDEVGDPHHLTFFEMLGNWSLGDYFKEEAITWSYEFLTSKTCLGFDPARLSVTVFRGNDTVPRDEESVEVWKKLGIPERRIFALPESDNWWGIPGGAGPCGPDTEMFVDTGRPACGPDCRPGCACGKFFEIWNDVFMQYRQTESGDYAALQQHNVDTGMGVERTAAMLQNRTSVYETELFAPVIGAISDGCGRKMDRDMETSVSFRILADHIRSAVFIIGDEQGIAPGNLGQGYVLRRLIRRAARHGKRLGLAPGTLKDLAQSVIEGYRHVYPELDRNRDRITAELSDEEEKFGRTLSRGLAELGKVISSIKEHNGRVLPGRVAFRMYDTCGFPLEFTEEICREEGIDVDKDSFEKAFAKHREVSRKGADKAFKGGLADASQATTRLHTATHLLHKALKIVLGDHVEQKGSNITPERLRFDFAHPAKMTPEEIGRVEDIVNEQIGKGLPVTMQAMSRDEALSQGATALFLEKYGDQVKVYSAGDFSMEICGGPHVRNTSELGRFRIRKEESSSAGVRRIRAVLTDNEST